MRRVVLAYSGSLASHTALTMLAAEPQSEVVAVVVGLGQRRELDGLRERARAAGARRCHVLDWEAEFAHDIVWPAVRAGIDPATTTTALATPLIARALSDIARMEQTTVVAHGAIGNAAARLAVALRAVAPALDVDAVIEGLPTDTAQRAWLAARGVDAGADTGLTAEQSLWERRVSGRALGEGWDAPPLDVYALTRDPGPLPPASIDIAFRDGRPLAINGVEMPLVDLLDSLTTIVGAHGVGRDRRCHTDHAGVVRCTVHETPALTVLRAAWHAIASQIPDPPDAALLNALSSAYNTVVMSGAWFSRGRRALDAAFDTCAAGADGIVRLTLAHGTCVVAGCRVGQYHS
ncbi:MAG: argininosuccinate synthase [Acidobacteria bacterium]|nr:argininosuccinate synthase [Acidobacteriota bacterium]